MAEAHSSMVKPKTPPLPTGTTVPQHQVAGHAFGKGKTKLGLLQLSTDGTLLKPVQNPPRGQREADFYGQVFNPQCMDPILLSLQPLVPHYVSTWTTPQQPGVLYIRMQDVMKRFKQPSILDVKVGRITYDPDATQEKIAQEQAKFPPLQKVGFQLTGMKVFDPVQETYFCAEKRYLRGLSEEEVLTKGLAVFLNNDVDVYQRVIPLLLKRLQTILDWFHKQRKFAFYASSLLLVYEGALCRCAKYSTADRTKIFSDGENAGASRCDKTCSDLTVPHHIWECSKQQYGVSEGEQHDQFVDIRMIDFAHVFPSGSRDDNYIEGVESLVKYLHRLL